MAKDNTKASTTPIMRDTEVYDSWVYIREWKEKFGKLPEDEDELAVCINYVNKRMNNPKWKPTLEQIGALKMAIEHYESRGEQIATELLNEVLEQLKTL